MSNVKPFSTTRRPAQSGVQMEHYDPVIDANFEEVRETLNTERSARVPAQSERKGPVSVGRLCAA